MSLLVNAVAIELISAWVGLRADLKRSVHDPALADAAVLRVEKRMRPTIIATLSVLTLCLASCGPSLDMSQIQVGANNVVSWEDAKTIVAKGKVKFIDESHSLKVRIIMRDGTVYRTTEPKSDAVKDWLKTCGKWGEIDFAEE